MGGLIESWVESANDPRGSFPLNNLPHGAFSTGSDRSVRLGVAVGDRIVDVAAAATEGMLPFERELNRSSWNAFMALGPEAWAEFRTAMIDCLRAGAGAANTLEPLLVPMREARMHLPFEVAEYTDFYASREHATNVGTMFRGAENALPPNWLHMPIGYNGRASTVVVSGTDIVRPCGQVKPPEADRPVFGASRRLDIELELGAVVGQPSAMGERVSVEEADRMMFGYVLLNDWSARDIQAFEYVPLGPFQGKAFATSISPWIVPKAALEPFRVAAPDREVPLLDHLVESRPGVYDIELSVALRAGDRETVLSRTNHRTLYYSAAQQLAHHASSGCAMRVGDLLGSGTISGADKGSLGSMLEMSWGGKEPIALDDGTMRTFLEDGDTAILRGHAQGDGYRVGFGECSGTILPARG